MKNQFATPILIKNGSESILERMPLSDSGVTTYDESWLQALLYSHPQALPIDEIDQSYENLIPICRELNTPAGPVDVLYVTPHGKLVILEAKLWRNPEARRKVIGQILDYAKEFGRWSYEDLQREVSRATRNESGTPRGLYEIVAEKFPETLEAQFIDAVTRNLRHGEFLLLIVGDGIREGVGAITEFLENNGTLAFTFGLVEMAIFNVDSETLLVQPRVIAQSMIIKRTVITMDTEGMIAKDESEIDEEVSAELTESQKFYQDFWQEFTTNLKFDDQSQPVPKPSKKGNIWLSMPAKNAWITIYCYQKAKQIGVFLTFNRGALGDTLYAELLKEKETIDKELGLNPRWESDGEKHSISYSTNFPDLKLPEYRQPIIDWLSDNSNRYVNVFRPRIERILVET